MAREDSFSREMNAEFISSLQLDSDDEEDNGDDFESFYNEEDEEEDDPSQRLTLSSNFPSVAMNFGFSNPLSEVKDLEKLLYCHWILISPALTPSCLSILFFCAQSRMPRSVPIFLPEHIPALLVARLPQDRFMIL